MDKVASTHRWSTLLLLNFPATRASRAAMPAPRATTKPCISHPAHTLLCPLSATPTQIPASNLTTTFIRLELHKPTRNLSQPSRPCRYKVTLSQVSRYLSTSITPANLSPSSSPSRCPCLPPTRDVSSPKTYIHLFRTHWWTLSSRLRCSLSERVNKLLPTMTWALPWPAAPSALPTEAAITTQRMRSASSSMATHSAPPARDSLPSTSLVATTTTTVPATKITKTKMAGKRRLRPSFAVSGSWAWSARTARRNRAVASLTVRMNSRRRRASAVNTWPRSAKTSSSILPSAPTARGASSNTQPLTFVNARNTPIWFKTTPATLLWDFSRTSRAPRFCILTPTQLPLLVSPPSNRFAVVQRTTVKTMSMKMKRRSRLLP